MESLTSNIDRTLLKIAEFEKEQSVYKCTLKEMSDKVKMLNFKRKQRLKNKTLDKTTSYF